MIFTIFVVTLVYIGWVEYSVGNILLRTDSNGGKSFNWGSLWNLMIHPLHNSTLWNKHSMDLNYPFVIGTTLLGYSIWI